MRLIPDDLRTRLRTNGQFNETRRNNGEKEIDFMPLVKLFDPCGAATWLLSEIDPHDPDIAFGLCDLVMGFPELGYVSLSEIESVKGPLGIGIEREEGFRATKTLQAYADEARLHQRIIA
ncbi:DUF2958 domain-containing protein [uncultured Bradyrhizobium sp.]|uniref:DUF2958 domain-containing protein n=1 Tax=uncultured Bradyrhizobium sp. TaxID=199684 RepID=UPI0035CA6E70